MSHKTIHFHKMLKILLLFVINIQRAIQKLVSHFHFLNFTPSNLLPRVIWGTESNFPYNDRFWHKT